MSNDWSVASLYNVAGTVVVVTGGGTGIGLMLTRALEHNGATVYILGRRLEVLEKAAKENNKHGKIIPFQCDVTSRESLQAAVQMITTQHGYVNTLINNSGILTNQLPQRNPDESIADFQKRLWDNGTQAEWDQTFSVNVSAVYYTSVAFLELLDAGNKKGVLPGVSSQVITISSLAALRRDEKTFSVSYAASKAAVTHLAKIFVGLFKDFDIRSNIIAPGLFPSEISAPLGLTPGMTVPSTLIPAKRTGDEQDMAGLVLFLTSRAGAYINGTIQIPDGGRLALFPSTY